MTLIKFEKSKRLVVEKVINYHFKATKIPSRQYDRAEDYLYKCNILKQIMSDKSHKFRNINNFQNGATVIVSSFLLFLGFSGLDKIKIYISWVYPISDLANQLLFNVFVFILFLIGTLHLVFQFGHKQSAADKAIVMLANLGNEIQDLVASSGAKFAPIDDRTVSLIRSKYETVIQGIPSNTDREYNKARARINEEGRPYRVFSISPQNLFDPKKQESIVIWILSQSNISMEILQLIRQVDKELYLGGGLLRNLVWDFLHGYNNPTPIEDVDIVYFDQLSKLKKHDLEIEKKLTCLLPNYDWSVRNQARMHITNDEKPYTDFHDAISKWPETATALAIKINDDETLDIVAPHGFDDLLRLVVKPTPHFANNKKVIEERVTKKNWATLWPNLRFLL